MLIINKKDEKIKYNFNYLKNNLDLNKFINLLENKAFIKWYLDPKADSNIKHYNIHDCAIFSCIHEKNNDPNLKKDKNDKLLLLSGFFDDEETAKLDFFFDAPPNFIVTTDYNKEIKVTISEKHRIDSKLHNEVIEEYKKDGVLLGKLNSNFKLKHNIQLCETIEQFKERDFETHSFIYSEISKKFYHVVNLHRDNVNAIVKFHDDDLELYEFASIISERWGDNAIINELGDTLIQMID
tara:strand:+ start:202 stop:918 length:717 start_codon:yes stop_codon:yes gene_type:complete